ncbi:hypothetical protein HMPREF9460_03247 [Flavonifractor plautii 1_3_50AFAA]|uniref:Probable multidrug resistance protein NorM n=1 Tax=Flavonifractor plautii 1_3_50AFAA TaxID=742738 RepID=A0A096CGJ7_FLAPL|nr:hypothetical protein HMPREF9460_03247 [Flavonifractor plautii 1_3_50AFAA]
MDLTRGGITRPMLLFAGPMIAGNLLQQCYNIADTLIVGRALGASALASVGFSFTLMTFLTSVLLGLCMGSGALWSMLYGAEREEELKRCLFASFVFIGAVAVLLNVGVLALLEPVMTLLRIPAGAWDETRAYLRVVLLGVCFTFLYNYFACLLRSVGNSVAPLAFLAVSTVLNIGLDLWFVLGLGWGVAGAAGATVLAQGVSAAGIALYGWRRVPLLRLERRHCKVSRGELGRIMNYSLLTCVQQSVMNFGILMVQGLVNSFGVNVMAAFAAAVKIDAFAYLPVQDFGNAFSTFVAQNTGAQKAERIRKGIRSALWVSVGFCLVSSLLVCLFAAPLMGLFVEPGETEIIAVGVEYLRIEGMCYCGIGILFFALRPVPRPGAARRVGGAHRGLPGDAGGPGLPAGPHPRRGPEGHLVGRAHRLGSGRSGRAGALPEKTPSGGNGLRAGGIKNRRGRNASPRRFLLFRSISRPSGSPGTRRRSSCGQ